MIPRRKKNRWIHHQYGSEDAGVVGAGPGQPGEVEVVEGRRVEAGHGGHFVDGVEGGADGPAVEGAVDGEVLVDGALVVLFGEVEDDASGAVSVLRVELEDETVFAPIFLEIAAKAAPGSLGSRVVDDIAPELAVLVGVGLAAPRDARRIEGRQRKGQGEGRPRRSEGTTGLGVGSAGLEHQIRHRRRHAQHRLDASLPELSEAQSFRRRGAGDDDATRHQRQGHAGDDESHDDPALHREAPRSSTAPTT
mmetsp:Transcript_9085/g.23068  ORF Transcript_9085/g.23068 Transcript_9085/m.23068 type:complete len:250 (-) Transcript_9085:18-767(-)